jgi:1-deoxy-D-xylulose-5-phosphate synthase
MAGKRPIVAIYSSFLQRAMDQITMDVALHGLPVVFLVDRAGVTGPDGPSHHGVFDLTFLRMIPSLVVGAPADAGELCGMLEAAVRHSGPIAIRFPKAAATSLPVLPAEPLEIGRWEELTTGEDVLFLATGRMLETAQKAAVTLAQSGVSCGVVNARWVKPLDDRLAEWVARYRTVVTLEDNVLSGGFGAAVMETLSETGLAGRVHLFGIPDRFLPAGSADEVIRSVGLDPDAVAERVSLLLQA